MKAWSTFKIIKSTGHAVSKSIFETLDELAVIDWKHKQDQQKKMLQKVKRSLYKLGYDVNTADKESKNIIHLVRNIL
ncbi:type I restriction enzyme endonuclease domain-containing protein [Methanococcoides seepicolus]|uniref:DUF3387 domain-containing protein n=1 Tax=Methanococcoides seepicolus TaxID=2828780 RepID=A0A9E5DBV9_9EURY|nr:DUF3387 domain-containing protein [Methanococcoides seepicolus]